ncbi:MAG: class II aldolase/adducin family protein [Armatimonadetes bacterium]|nr:class II aldolase/adducin family protein [Armatimonadota bacterium]
MRREMSRVGRRLYDLGLVGAREGNVSARLPNGNILCTPSGACKGDLAPEALVVLRPDGIPVCGGTPSSEIRLHLRAFRDRPDCMAVVHAHPPTATAFALAGETIPDGYLPEAAVVLGTVKLLPFAMPGTDEVPEGLAPYLKDHKTFLLANHGAATLGKDLWDACDRMETLERVANVLLRARILGGAKSIPEAAHRAIIERFPGGQLGT